MNIKCPLRYGLALIGLVALGSAVSRPASAQELTYTLGSVTFYDGAVAFGSFEFNPTTKVFGPYDITTTEGVTNALTGAHYLPQNGGAETDAGVLYDFGDSGTLNFLNLETDAIIKGPGLYALSYGTVQGSGFSGSGEFTYPPGATFSTARAIETGYLYVVDAVPEVSTTVSFGLLLTLGLSSIVIASRRKKVRPLDTTLQISNSNGNITTFD